MRGSLAHPAAGIRARCLCAVQDNLRDSGPDDSQEFGAGSAGEIRRVPQGETVSTGADDRAQQGADQTTAEGLAQPQTAAPGPQGLRGRTTGLYLGRCINGTDNGAVFL